MRVHSLTDDRLSEMYESLYKGHAFYQTPKLKRFILWVVCTVFPVLGISALTIMVTRAPTFMGVLVLLGIVGTACLCLVLKEEAAYSRRKQEIEDELLRRELYDKSKAVITGPM